MKHGVDAFLSNKSFNNGTERCYFTAKHYKARSSDIVINLQADEFNINVSNINNLIKKLKNSKTVSIATLMYKSSDNNEYSNANNVKVVVDKHSRQLLLHVKR